MSFITLWNYLLYRFLKFLSPPSLPPLEQGTDVSSSLSYPQYMSTCHIVGFQFIFVERMNKCWIRSHPQLSQGWAYHQRCRLIYQDQLQERLFRGYKKQRPWLWSEVAGPGEEASEPRLGAHWSTMKGRYRETKRMHLEGQTLDPELGSWWLGQDESREENLISKEHPEGSFKNIWDRVTSVRQSC